MESAGRRQVMKPARIHYPWLSTLGALSVVGWQFLLAYPELAAGFSPPPWFWRDDMLLIAGALLLLLVVFDVWRFVKASARSRDQLAQYQEQISELFDSKRELGTRARTYSDHADKLKMFISERLLEYIEYDEKFLHFKNIASEVRHNGVISYDKAQTALRTALETCKADQRPLYQEAADGLLYLWDLLDLSTTDNIALHVTNQIYDCEEHYFQAQLNEAAAGDAPFEPTFQMSHALRRALLPITEDADALGLNFGWPRRGSYSDDKFSIQLRSDSEMLGNENHMVLLIENLVNNALFYSQQKQHKNRHSRVVITLAQKDGDVEFRVYNRGPHIDEDEKDRIYQLGFSSRRVREHHGKGLGLYFVDQIVRGFEGSIEFSNIDNQAERLALSVKLGNGELHNAEVEILETAGRPQCRLADADDEPGRRVEWPFSAPIASIEVSRRGARKPQLIAELERDQNSTHYDARDAAMPGWLLEVRNARRSSRLLLQPLDLRGVEFTVSLPSAKSRLDNPD